MRKFINFAKKSLLIITASIFVVFTALLIIISSLPKGKKYEYEFSAIGITMEVDYTFDGDEVIMDSYVLAEHDTAKTKYKINKGDLYLMNVDTAEWEYAGEINAYEIVMKASAEETGIGNMEIVLECKTNKAIRTVAIVFMCISGVLAGACVAIYYLDKKGMLKFADNNTIVVPVVDNTIVIPSNSVAAEPVMDEGVVAEEKVETVPETEEIVEPETSVETEEKSE